MEKISEKERIKLDVKYRLRRGEKKQQILEELSQLYKDKVTLVRQIEITPSKTAKSKYGILNFLLAALLIAVFVLDILLIIKIEKRLESGNGIIIFNTIISIVLDLFFIVSILSYRIELYSWIAARAFVTLITIIILLGYFQVSVHPFIYLSLVMVITSFIFGLWLGIKKLCPPRVPKIIEIDIDGIEKIKKTILVYPD